MRFVRAWQAILAALLLLGPMAPVHAQAVKTVIESCGDLNTQSDMNDCAATVAKKADEALNATYAELLNKVKENKTATEKVVAAEKAWIVFRDAELAAEWPVAEGENPNILYGSVHPFCYYNEFATMTRERAETLKELMQSEEGDVCSSGLAQTGQYFRGRTCNSNPRGAAARVGTAVRKLTM